MSETLFDNFPGEQLSGAILNQDLTELKEHLIDELNERDESGPSYNQVPLYTNGKKALSLYYLEPGSVLKNQQLPENTAILQLVEGKMCFQSDDVHVHPVTDEIIYLEPGTPFSLQADKPSLLLMTIL